MWIKLDFTPLYIGGLVVGLVLIAIGLSIRSSFPKIAALGIFIAVVGAIPAAVGGFFLIAERIGKWSNGRRNRTWIEQLAEDREIQGLHLPGGTKVEWFGRPAVISGATLAQPLQVLGLPLEGELKFSNTFTGGGDIYVATDLEKGTLAADRLIDGVPCKAHHEVEFFRAGGPDPDHGRIPKARIGKLRRCTSSVELEFQGNRYLADSEVTLNFFDGVERGTLAVDQDVDGHWCKQGTEVERPEEKAIRFTLARDEVVGGIACKAGTEVVLERGKGHVVSAVLSHDQKIDGIPCRGGEAVGFEYGGGSYPLDSCVISRSVAILDVAWPAGSTLRGLSMVWLGVTLPAGSSPVAIGEVKIEGRCRVQLKKAPPALEGVESLDEKTAYAEFRGARFTDFNIFEGSGYGHLAEAAIFEGTSCKAGALVRFTIGPPK